MKLFGKNDPPRSEPVVERKTPVPVVRRSARRSWKAARPDNFANGFSFGQTSSREVVRQDHRGLVNHSRHAARNFDQARNYEMLIRRHVVGKEGIRLKMDVRTPDGSKDRDANRIIQNAFTKWARMGQTTPCGRLSWWGVQCVGITALAREGVFLARKHRGRSFGDFGFQIEPLPLDLLDTDLTRTLPNGGFIEMGVECNRFGKPRAFHFWNAPQDAGHLSRYRKRVRVPASDIIMATLPEEVAQLLGVPRTSTGMRMMNLRERFITSAMVAANYGAAQMMFFETESGGGYAPADDDEFDEPPEQIEAGTTAILPPGLKAVPHDPKYPDQAVGPFLKTMDTSTASGLGVSHETLSGDLSGANFSSLRAGKGEERDEWQMVQRGFYEGFHDHVFRDWLGMAMLRGKLGNLPMSRMEDYDAARWRPRGWPSVNPKDDASANASDLDNGLKSRSEICEARGVDFEELVEEIAAEEEAIRAANVDPARFNKRLAAAAASPPETPEGSSEEPEQKG